MAVSMRQRQDRLKKVLLEKSWEFERRMRQEIRNRIKEAPNLFEASAKDEGDFSVREQEQNIHCKRINFCTQNLKQIAAALNRLRQANYGICEECGAEIGEKRLQVMPFALYCFKCQEAIEDSRMTQEISEWLAGKNPAKDE